MKKAVYFGSREIYQDMIPAAKSLLMNSDVDKIYFLIEDDAFPEPLPEIIEVMNIRDIVPMYYSSSGPNYGTEWTYIGLIRTALTKVFPDDDKILSIDCDTIVVQDISELWDIPLDGYYFAAVRETLLSDRQGTLYTNAGVCMMNLKKLREDGVDDRMIHVLNTYRFRYVCQDVMNLFCQDAILELPSDYNVCQFTKPTSTMKIRHYAGERVRWRGDELVLHYKAFPWSDIRSAGDHSLSSLQGAVKGQH